MKHDVTIDRVLRERADREPDATAVSFLAFGAGGRQQRVMTYGELDRRARAIASSLQARCARGDRAVLVYESGLTFVEAFFGCLYAGVIAVPAAPPRPRLQHGIVGLARNCAARVLLRESRNSSGQSEYDGAFVCQILTSEIASEEASGYIDDGGAASQAIAFLQYTSGSTGDPKGVIVTHQALIANLAQIKQAFAHHAGCVGVNWLPLHHDMGLIGAVLQPIYVGFPTHLMSPLSFIQRPERWLDAIGAFGGTTCGGPSFAFRHCVERIPEHALSRFDLRSWRVAFSGAEPIHPETMRQFAQRFACTGFDARALLPCYGLAEATLYVTSGRYGAGMTARRFDAEALTQQRGELWRPTAEQPGLARELIACGLCDSIDGNEVFVSDAAGNALPSGAVGEICVSGPSVSRGYWASDETNGNAPETTRDDGASQPSGRRVLKTGDLGFNFDGELYITGRSKDLIIVDGRNIAPHDLEWTAEGADEAVCGAAAVALDDEGNERPALFVEIRGRHARERLEQIGNAVRHAVADAHGVPLAALVLVRAATLSRTTSGKLARSRCQAAYANAELDECLRWSPRRGWHARSELEHIDSRASA